MSEAGGPIARLDFEDGPLRGSHLVLLPACVVHRGEAELETLPLATIASVRVAFERDARKLGWGMALVLAALALLALSAPLGGFAGSAAAEIAAAGAQGGVARALHGSFRLLELLASLLPVIALATALGGIVLAILGWLGNTRITLTLAGYERAYPARGRNTRLMDFAELLSEQLMALRR